MVKKLYLRGKKRIIQLENVADQNFGIKGGILKIIMIQ